MKMARGPRPRLGKKRSRPLIFEGWNSKFRAFISQDPTCEKCFNAITRKGGEGPAILELLHDECYANVGSAAAFIKEGKDLQIEASKLVEDAANLAVRIRRINKLLLSGVDLEENVFLIWESNRLTAVPVTDFANLPAVLGFYSQRMKTLSRDLESPIVLDARGPELTILAIYIKEIIGSTPFKPLCTLLEAAKTFLLKNDFQSDGAEEDNFQSEDAVRKMVQRFNRRHPQSHQIAKEMIINYVASRKLGAPADPGFWERLYERLYEIGTDIL
jgi:hypothetical protein